MCRSFVFSLSIVLTLFFILGFAVNYLISGQLDGLGVSPIPGPTCTGNGDVMLGYGSAEYIGLGFSVMIFLVFIELFGSVFMKNCNVILALLFG
mmetsp:Transcript_12606/g.17891  ORF Transcript_12606/g.17891 Transcript_12606/m.17891 type:complete len:94 (-) Transcript_12606:47-328(-)